MVKRNNFMDGLLLVWQSAAKSQVNLGKVQRLPEEFSLLNNRQERPAPLIGEDIVQPLRKLLDNWLTVTLDDSFSNMLRSIILVHFTSSSLLGQ